MRLNFQNRYGQLALTLVDAVRPVKGIRGVDVEDQHKFGIDVAEKIALISDNRGIQICPCKDGDGKWVCFVIAHDSPSTGAVARIESMNYLGLNPTQEIQAARRSDHAAFCLVL